MMKNIIFGAPKGGIAQLARALAWHARGREFESHYLHPKVEKPPRSECCSVFLVGFHFKASTTIEETVKRTLFVLLSC